MRQYSKLIFLYQCSDNVSNLFAPLSSNEDVDEGFVINQEGIGLRLTAMEYWKCSKAGISLPFVDKKEPDCKFVIAESLPEQGNDHNLICLNIKVNSIKLLLYHSVLYLDSGKNQVDTFLEQHRAPGIQHIGLYTKDIVSTAHAMAASGVQFFSPPPAYYTAVCTVKSYPCFVQQVSVARIHDLVIKDLLITSCFYEQFVSSHVKPFFLFCFVFLHNLCALRQVGKQQEIEEAGHNPQMLAQHGILLDTDLHQNPSSLSTSSQNRR